MIEIPATPRRARLAASVLGVTLIAVLGVSAPFTVNVGGLSMQEALAGRGGGGNGGGHGGGHGHGRGGASDSTTNLTGTPGARGSGVDHAAASATRQSESPEDNSSAAAAGTSDALGALNSAHASRTAFANASEESVVGKLSAYMDDMKAYLDTLGGDEAEQDAALEAAADDLADAANKDAQLDAETVDALNELLDGKADGFTHDAMDGDPVHDAEPALADLINPPPAE